MPIKWWLRESQDEVQESLCGACCRAALYTKIMYGVPLLLLRRFCLHPRLRTVQPMRKGRLYSARQTLGSSSPSLNGTMVPFSYWARCWVGQPVPTTIQLTSTSLCRQFDTIVLDRFPRVSQLHLHPTHAVCCALLRVHTRHGSDAGWCLK